MRIRLAALVGAALLAGAARAADTPPAPPYYTVQVETVGSRAKALELVKALGEADARAEKRSNGYVVRFGAWPTRQPAEAGLAKHKAGHKAAKVMYVTKPSDWILAGGQTLVAGSSAPARAAPPAAAAAHAAPSAPATKAAPPAAAPLAAPAAVEIPMPPPRSSRPATVKFSNDYYDLAQKFDTETRRLLRTDGTVRRDGYLYAMDVAVLLLYAAERADQSLYLQLLPSARKVILDPAPNPFLEGFVLWRHKDGQPPEVSGATEAGWMARALWAGAKAFNRAEDKALALRILDGYARHAFEQPEIGQNTWFVRKYYAFDANQFANLSTLGNYQPDFMSDAETEASGAWKGMAERGYALLERASDGKGLFKSVILPEVGATWPGTGGEVFAPNDLGPLEDSCDAAEAAVRGRPKLAERVLDFTDKGSRQNAFGRLYAYYDMDTGDPAVTAVPLSTTGYACLGELAAMLGDNGAWKRLEPQLIIDMQQLPTLALSMEAPLYSAGPLLRTALLAGAFSR